jgi:fatty acid desaturase
LGQRLEGEILNAAQEAAVHASRGRGIPIGINLVLALVYAAANLYQFVFLPVLLLPSSVAWAWTLLPLVFLTNPFWSLIHESIHDLFHPNRNVNAVFGRLLGILFGSPFRILRLSHLVHHRLNRMPVEGTEYYDRAASTKARAAPGYYFQILLGLYLVEVVSPLYFLLPGRLLSGASKRFLRPESVSGVLMKSWLGADSLREIRCDGLLTFCWLALGFFCYGDHWALLAMALAARGFLISFLDNVYHYATPVGDIFYARNLRMPGACAKALLHFNLHGIHHLNPAIPWIDLPRAFAAQAGSYHGAYFVAALGQLRGPIALQELPQGSSAMRLRSF